MALALAAILETDELAFRALADAAPVMLWTADADGVCNFFNARWCAFAGLRPDQLTGHGWSELLHPHDRERHLQRYQRAVFKRMPFEAQSRMQRGDGQWRWIRAQAVPRFLAAGGRLAGFIGAALDVTEYREVEAVLQRELIERAAQERALWLRLADLQETERRRLCSELHDRAGEPLTALRLKLAALLKANGLDAEVRRQLEQCIGYAGTTADVIGGAMSDLRPPMLDEYGLAAALHWYAEQLDSTKLEVV